MKRGSLLLLGVFVFTFAFIANVSAQIKINSSGKVGIGGEPAAATLRIHDTIFPNFVLEGISTRLQIGISIFNGSFSPFAKTNDIVYRPLGAKHGLIFCMPNISNDGNQYIKFGDDANGGWVSIFNNRHYIY